MSTSNALRIPIHGNKHIVYKYTSKNPVPKFLYYIYTLKGDGFSIFSYVNLL
jgi:hypothetical protein